MTVLRWLALALGFALVASRAEAVEVKEVTTPLGIKAWLVEDSSAPVVALTFSFASGSASDPENQKGLTSLTASFADRRCGSARRAGLQAASGGCLRRVELRGLARVRRRLAAPAVRSP